MDQQYVLLLVYPVVQITPSEVEFWNKEEEEMELMHIAKEYPPRFTIEVSGEQAVDGSCVKVTFTGVDEHYLGSMKTRIPLVHHNFWVPERTSQTNAGVQSTASRTPG